MTSLFEKLGAMICKKNIVVINLLITFSAMILSMTITVMTMIALNVVDFRPGILLSLLTPLFGSPPITHILLTLLVRMHNINQQLRTTKMELKVYQDLLPICANCKDIRDEQGHWKKIDTYFSQHSEVNFTHSICPSCSKELYGNYLKSHTNPS